MLKQRRSDMPAPPALINADVVYVYRLEGLRIVLPDGAFKLTEGVAARQILFVRPDEYRGVVGIDDVRKLGIGVFLVLGLNKSGRML